MVNRKVILAVLLIILAAVLAGCGQKTALSAEDYVSIMEVNGYEVQDATAQYEGMVESCHIAIKGDFEYQIEFYVVASESQASDAYSQNKDTFESEAIGVSSTFTSEAAHHEKYTQVNNGKYNVVSRIDNTFLFVDTTDEYRDQIEGILDTLGY